MAYNYYPQNYVQNYQQPQMPTQTQGQLNGLVPVPSEMVARNYPVAYGQSVSFRDENEPYLYTKTMGFSQLEPPKFEKYRLVKEEPETHVSESKKEEPNNDANDEIKAEIEAIKRDIEDIREKIKPRTSKGVKKDDAESE